jgi:hypothetical protein
VLRLVFGLGTRAVDRSDDDYTRIVALNAADRRPETHFNEVRQFAQKKVDVLDLQANRLVTSHFIDVAQQSRKLKLDLFASRDRELERLAAERDNRDIFSWVLTFQKLLKNTDFINDMRDMLTTLQEAYDYPVDIEFTANFTDNAEYRIGLLQCRPLQVKGGGKITDPPKNLARNDIVMQAQGAIIGRSRLVDIDRFIYIVPSEYAKLVDNDRAAIARLVGRLTHIKEPGMPKSIMLLGPGRWGTSTPSLGVPTAFPDISPASILCEIVTMSENLTPDMSLGTHFFNELVETDLLYIAISPDDGEAFLNREFFEESPNKFPLLLPDSAKWSEVIKVIDASDLAEVKLIRMNANTLNQKAVCYFESGTPKDDKETSIGRAR